MIILGALVQPSGCGPLRREGQGESRAGVLFEGSAVILTGDALKDGPGTVLAAMSGKVPNFRVRQHSGQCPEITLRANVSFQGEVNPQVYVDGTRTSDTCILETLRTDDVERVEVYPQGFTTRPGYATHAHGLILVFMRSAGER
jgi:hypothetical protein